MFEVELLGVGGDISPLGRGGTHFVRAATLLIMHDPLFFALNFQFNSVSPMSFRNS